MEKRRGILRKLLGWSTKKMPETDDRVDHASTAIEDVSPAITSDTRGQRSARAHPPPPGVRQTPSTRNEGPSVFLDWPRPSHLRVVRETPERLLTRRLIQWSLVGAVAVSASLSIKLYEVVPHPHSPGEATQSWLLELLCVFLLEIGIGIIVACILARTLESFLHQQSQQQHRKQIRRIQTQTLKALFGIHVEREFYDELANLIFRYKLRRKDFTVVYQFEPTLGVSDRIAPEDKLKLTVTVSYKLSNISRRNLPYPLTHWFEMLLPGEDENQDFQRLAIEGCHVDSGEENVVWEGEVLQRHLKTEGVRRIVSTRISIPPGQTAQVEFTYVIIKRAADTDIWLSTVPADSLRIIVVADGKLRSLRFWPDAIHWNQPVLVRHVPEGNLRTYEWRIDNIILPNQGILLFWRPNDQAAAASGAQEEKKEIAAGSESTHAG